MEQPAVPTVRFTQVAPNSPEATAAMTAYFAELDTRFTDGFDSRGAFDDAAAAMSAPKGAFLIARSDDGHLAGCGGLQALTPHTAELKRMWIAPSWRGAGLGKRLLAELEVVAANLGYSVVMLDTNATLKEAISMYESAGFQQTERYNDNPYAHHWFIKQL